MLRRNKEQQALIDFTKELEGIFEEFYEFQLEDITLAYQSVNINHFWNYLKETLADYQEWDTRLKYKGKPIPQRGFTFVFIA